MTGVKIFNGFSDIGNIEKASNELEQKVNVWLSDNLNKVIKN